MPLQQTDIPGNATGARITVTEAIDRGRLKAVSVVVTTAALFDREAYAEISLARGPNTLQDKAIILGAGPLTPGQGIAWTGDIPIDGPMFIMCVYYTTNNINARLSYISEV